MEEASCELAGILGLDGAMEGDALRSTLPLRPLIFGERREARFGSTGPSVLASASLYDDTLDPTVDPDRPWNVGVDRTEGEGAESLAVMVLDATEEEDTGRPDTEGDMAGLDATEEGLAKEDMSTRARPVPGVGRFAVGVDKEGEE